MKIKDPWIALGQETTRIHQGVWVPFHTWTFDEHVPVALLTKRRAHTKVSSLWYKVLNFGGVQTDGFFRFDEWLWERR